jgi:outer membrane protein TolC
MERFRQFVLVFLSPFLIPGLLAPTGFAQLPGTLPATSPLYTAPIMTSSPALSTLMSQNASAAAEQPSNAKDPASGSTTAKPAEDPPMTLKCPQLEATDLQLPINLPAALRLADDRPLVVVGAQASVWVAEGQLQHACLLWVPQLNLGFDYTRHDGFGPDLNLGINTAARPLNNNVNFFYGGAGLIMQVALSDVIFTPLAAKQVLNSRKADIQTGKNDAMLETARAYFTVHQYRGMYAGALDCVERGKALVERIEALAKDLVPRIEIDRARQLLADLEQRAASAREGWRVASADLTQVLRLDPRAVVVPLEHDHTQITLIDPGRCLDELMPIALTNRPELASQQSLVQAAMVRIRQEKLRPLTPTLLMQGFQTPEELLQVGAMGLGNGGKLNLWSARDDISPQVMWQLDACGLGNLARIKEQRGMQSQEIVRLFRVQDRVAAEVTRAQARLQSAAVRAIQAERSLREALITYNGNYEGLRQTTRLGTVLIQVYRPQEVDIALEHLRDSYDEYFMTVADYNRAQFELFHALGYPAQEIACMRPPGEALPVETERPAFLPAVGKGPPPATR